MTVGRRRRGLPGTAVAGVITSILLAGTGCASAPEGVVRGPGAGVRAGIAAAPERLAPAESGRSTEGEIPIFVWVSRALDGAGEGEMLPAIRGREQEYFLAVLEQVAKEARDVGAVVRGAARELAGTGGTPGASVVVRELWARECCMRRSFLAAGLHGLVDGLKARSAVAVQEAGTALSLGELAGHPDAEVAAAARAALRYFTVGLPGS